MFASRSGNLVQINRTQGVVGTRDHHRLPYHRNFCPYSVVKTVSCLVPNGTETYQTRVAVGGAFQTMTMERPRLVTSYKEVKETNYACCPGFYGDNCDTTCFNCTQMAALESRVRLLEARVLRSRGRAVLAGTENNEVLGPDDDGDLDDLDFEMKPIKMGRPDVSHVNGHPLNGLKRSGGARGGVRGTVFYNRNGRLNGRRAGLPRNGRRRPAGTEPRPDFNDLYGSEAGSIGGYRQGTRGPPGPPGPPGPKGEPGLGTSIADVNLFGGDVRSAMSSLFSAVAALRENLSFLDDRVTRLERELPRLRELTNQGDFRGIESSYPSGFDAATDRISTSTNSLNNFVDEVTNVIQSLPGDVSAGYQPTEESRDDNGVGIDDRREEETRSTGEETTSSSDVSRGTPSRNIYGSAPDERTTGGNILSVDPVNLGDRYGGSFAGREGVGDAGEPVIESSRDVDHSQRGETYDRYGRRRTDSGVSHQEGGRQTGGYEDGFYGGQVQGARQGGGELGRDYGNRPGNNRVIGGQDYGRRPIPDGSLGGQGNNRNGHGGRFGQFGGSGRASPTTRTPLVGGTDPARQTGNRTRVQGAGYGSNGSGAGSRHAGGGDERLTDEIHARQNLPTYNRGSSSTFGGQAPFDSYGQAGQGAQTGVSVSAYDVTHGNRATGTTTDAIGEGESSLNRQDSSYSHSFPGSHDKSSSRLGTESALNTPDKIPGRADSVDFGTDAEEDTYHDADEDSYSGSGDGFDLERRPFGHDEFLTRNYGNGGVAVGTSLDGFGIVNSTVSAPEYDYYYEETGIDGEYDYAFGYDDYDVSRRRRRHYDAKSFSKNSSSTTLPTSVLNNSSSNIHGIQKQNQEGVTKSPDFESIISNEIIRPTTPIPENDIRRESHYASHREGIKVRSNIRPGPPLVPSSTADGRQLQVSNSTSSYQVNRLRPRNNNGYPQLQTLKRLANKWRAKRKQLRRMRRNAFDELTWI
ncbi:EMI domain [Trinorchestia longiramus]|nr:EMI domain [Trinorchestia longiramus]